MRIERPLPFLCECGRAGCTAVLHVSPREYERVRATPSRFIVIPGHEAGVPRGVAVERVDGAVVVEVAPHD
jgi:hypothetical protein